MKWINAKDELPNEDEDVLICITDEDYRAYDICTWFCDELGWFNGDVFYPPKDYEAIYWTRDYKME